MVSPSPLSALAVPDEVAFAPYAMAGTLADRVARAADWLGIPPAVIAVLTIAARLSDAEALGHAPEHPLHDDLADALSGFLADSRARYEASRRAA